MDCLDGRVCGAVNTASEPVPKASTVEHITHRPFHIAEVKGGPGFVEFVENLGQRISTGGIEIVDAGAIKDQMLWSGW